jgi:uncharacterized protein YjbJ (UPF0337 family)
MRSIIVLTAAVALGALPLTANAQSSPTTTPASPTTTSRSEAGQIWEKFRGAWSQTKGAIKEQWGKLTDDDLAEIQGRREQLVGKVQTRYGISREQAEAQVSTWEQKHRDM